MDRLYSKHQQSHSQAHSSRPSSGTATREVLLDALQLVEASPDTLSSPAFSRTTPQYSQADGTALDTASSIAIAPFGPQSTLRLESDPALHTGWLQTSRLPTQATTTLDAALLPPVEPLQRYFGRRNPSTSSPKTGQPASMSTVALQYDPTFNMAGRSSFTWPVMENANLLGHELGSYASDVSLSPPHGSRSVTRSPPGGILTAEQRELKRQRDQARRDSKMSQRQSRADSSSSSYVHSPSVGMADLSTGSSNMPIYTTAPSQISVLAEPVSALAPPHYMPSYSPPLDSQNNMFSQPYSPQAYMPLGYSSGYQQPTSSSLPSHYGSSMGDPNMMYPVQPVMAASSHPGQESAHVRVVQSRPKPQCWEHGCNGRQFSTFSNLLRHQREKSGHATKASCPNCGAEFTRTTARNGHLLHDKCKQKRNSTSSQ